MNSNAPALITAIKLLEQDLNKRKTIVMGNGYVVDTYKGYQILSVNIIPNNGGFRFLLRTFDHPANFDINCDLTELIMKGGRVYDEADWVKASRKGCGV